MPPSQVGNQALHILSLRSILLLWYTCIYQTCWVIATGRAERDVSGDLKGALKAVKRKHFSKLDEKDFPAFLQQLEAYDSDILTSRDVAALFRISERAVRNLLAA